jgi:hypothetical protein
MNAGGGAAPHNGEPAGWFTSFLAVKQYVKLVCRRRPERGRSGGYSSCSEGASAGQSARKICMLTG